MAQLGEGHIRERGRVKVMARRSMQLYPPSWPVPVSPLRRYVVPLQRYERYVTTALRAAFRYYRIKIQIYI